MVGLGSSGVGIGLSINLIDRFTMNANRVAASMDRVSAKSNALMATNLRMARTWGIGMAIVGALGSRAMGAAHSAFREFNWEMVTTAAVTQKSTADLEKLDKIVKSLAQRSIFNPQEIASASTRLAKAGFELKQIEETMEGVVLLGTATDTGVGGKRGVADMMAKIMRSFDIAPESSTRVADVITKAVNSAAMDMEDAFEALKFLGNTSFNLGLQLEETMGMVGVLANAGVPQGIAGRGLVNALNKIATSVSSFATKGNQDALKAIGLSAADVKDAKGNLLPIVEILDRMIEGTAKMGNADKIAALAKLLRLRGSRAILPLLSEYNKSGGKTLKEFVNMLKFDSTGEALRVAEQRMASAKGVFTILGDVWDTLKVTWGEAIDNVLTPFFKILTSVLRKIIEFVQTPIGKWFAIALTGFFGLLTVGGLVVILISSLGLLMTTTAGAFSRGLASMTWGMNAFAAATMRAFTANTALNATSWVGVGGQAAVKGMKGFQSAATMATMSGGTGLLAGIGRVFTGLVRFIGPLGLIAGILGMIVGWKNLLRGVVVIIGTITNLITLIFDAIIGLFTGDIFKAFEKFTDAQSTLGKKGMFAPPEEVIDYKSYGGEAAYKQFQNKKAISKLTDDKARYRAQAEADPLDQGARMNFQLTNNVVIEEEVIQEQVKYYTDKELGNILNN